MGPSNVISTPKTTSCRRSPRESPPTRSSCRLRSRPSKSNTKTGWRRSASGRPSARDARAATFSAAAAAWPRPSGPQPGLRRLLRGRCRGGRRPQGFRGALAQGSVHLGRADPPRRRQQQMVRRHPDRPRNQVVLLDAQARGQVDGPGRRASEPGPLRQGSSSATATR